MSGTKNTAAGATEYIKGKLLWVWGRLTGNRSMQARGAGHKAKGGARYGFGKAQRSVDKRKR